MGSLLFNLLYLRPEILIVTILDGFSYVFVFSSFMCLMIL